MTLISIDTGKEISRFPFQREFDAVRSKLSKDEFDLIIGRVNELIDETIATSGKEIVTAGWMPGRDWTGTVFDPIYTKGTGRNYDLSAKWFGLAVWYTVMKRPERWGSGRYEKDGKDIGSRTYFRLS